MDLQRAMMAKIISEPDNDLPRLIYADWLEEQGDPRGEFVRLQCRLARMTPADADWKPLKHRERELLAAHEKTWVGPLGKLHGAKFVFERGLLKNFVCSAARFVQKNYQRALQKQIPLVGCERLWLSGEAKSLDRMVESEVLAWFPRLTWNNNWQGCEELAPLAESLHLHRLQSLSLGGFRFDFNNLAALAWSEKLPMLRILSLVGTLDTAGVVNLVGGRLELRSLYLAGCKQFSLEDFLRTAEEKLQRLQSFQFWEGAYTPLLPLATCPHLTSLHTLKVSNLIVSNEGLRAMIDNPAFERLVHFSFVPCQYESPLDPGILRALRDRFPQGDPQDQ